MKSVLEDDVPGLPCLDPDCFLCGQDKDLAVTDMPGTGIVTDGIHDVLDQLIFHDQLNLYLWHEIIDGGTPVAVVLADLIFRATVPDIVIYHGPVPSFNQGFPDISDPFGSHKGFDFFHRSYRVFNKNIVF